MYYVRKKGRSGIVYRKASDTLNSWKVLGKIGRDGNSVMVVVVGGGMEYFFE